MITNQPDKIPSGIHLAMYYSVNDFGIQPKKVMKIILLLHKIHFDY